jgi:anti-sigma factor RsiW
MIGHQEIEELLGAYALDAVDDDEGRVVEAHVATCPRCRAELAEHRAVTGLFAFSGQEAPGGLWDRISAGMHEAPPPLRLDRVRPGLVAGNLGAYPDVRTKPASPADHPGAGAVRQLRRAGVGSSGRRPLLRRALAVAAALVVVGLAVQVARLDAATPTRQHLAGGLTMADVVAAIRAPGAREVTLTSPDIEPGSSNDMVKVVIDPNGRGYLYDVHLTPLTVDRTYQLWGVVGSQRISYGLLGTDPGIEEFQGGTGLSALAITDEVATGVVVTHQPFTVSGFVSPPL